MPLSRRSTVAGGDPSHARRRRYPIVRHVALRHGDRGSDADSVRNFRPDQTELAALGPRAVVVTAAGDRAGWRQPGVRTERRHPRRPAGNGLRPLRAGRVVGAADRTRHVGGRTSIVEGRDRPHATGRVAGHHRRAGSHRREGVAQRVRSALRRGPSASPSRGGVVIRLDRPPEGRMSASPIMLLSPRTGLGWAPSTSGNPYSRANRAAI